MRFIIDENTGPGVARWLLQKGHTAFSVYKEARGIDDEEVLKRACEDNYIIITCDKDFGSLIYRERREHRGVILLRLKDDRTQCKIDVLEKLLLHYGCQLDKNFVVATEKLVRIVNA
ncbi:MAG: DUF5615 family PIN-like protein [Candidatus Eremiobacteraeota bacterium]|nr:DUF5615 family PIN-like protein [Candidatus Eremiobacteraeota bacterium]